MWAPGSPTQHAITSWRCCVHCSALTRRFLPSSRALGGGRVVRPTVGRCIGWRRWWSGRSSTGRSPVTRTSATRPGAGYAPTATPVTSTFPSRSSHDGAPANVLSCGGREPVSGAGEVGATTVSGETRTRCGRKVRPLAANVNRVGARPARLNVRTVRLAAVAARGSIVTFWRISDDRLAGYRTVADTRIAGSRISDLIEMDVSRGKCHTDLVGRRR